MRNVELLESTMQHLKDHPETHRQGLYLHHGECGTVGCFAGWACMLSGYKLTQDRDIIGAYYVAKDGGKARHPRDVAIELLGLEQGEAPVLFNGSNTRDMLELMVKDLVNGDDLQHWGRYAVQCKQEVYTDGWFSPCPS